MTRHALVDVDFVAVLGDPPRYPWSPVSSVVCAIAGENCLLVADAIGGREIHGHLVPLSWLEEMTARGIADRLDPPIEAKPEHLLVRLDDGEYALRSRDAIFGARRQELDRRLSEALNSFCAHADEETLRERFDAAYVVAPDDIVAVSLRAGAAKDRGSPDWQAETIEDLVRVTEHHGVLLANVRARPGWSTLPQPVADDLLDAATLALSRALAAPTDLLAPAPADTFKRAALIAARWRQGGARAIPGISQRTLRAALKGDRVALHEAELAVRAAGSHEHVTSQPLDEARARLTDLEHFAQTVYALELRVRSRDRGNQWRGFLSEVAGIGVSVRPRAWQEGEALAQDLRERLGFNGEAIKGVTHLLSRRAGVLVQGGKTIESVDALSAVSSRVPPCVEFVGPRIDERPGVARFALAHQLCHLLVDRHGLSPSSWACSSRSHGEHLGRQEQRASAFATYFLAPRAAVLKLAPKPIPVDQSEFIDCAMRVRDTFGLTAVTSGEHLLNCWASLQGPERRTAISSEIRARLMEAADRGKLLAFDDDCPPDSSSELSASSELRKGVFADLVRTAVRSGQLDPRHAVELMGSTGAREWLSAPD